MNGYKNNVPQIIFYDTFFTSLFTNILGNLQRPNDFRTKHAILLGVQYKIVKINSYQCFNILQTFGRFPNVLCYIRQKLVRDTFMEIILQKPNLI